MPQIKIPTPLREYTGNEAEVAVRGVTVGSALDNLVEQYPDLQPHLFEDGQLRQFVNIFIGEEDVRFLDGLATELEPDDRLRIIPSIAGGISQLARCNHLILRRVNHGCVKRNPQS